MLDIVQTDTSIGLCYSFLFLFILFIVFILLKQSTSGYQQHGVFGTIVEKKKKKKRDKKNRRGS